MDAKELSPMLRLNSVPESYVPTEEVREARALVRGRHILVENRTKYANKIQGILSDHGITEVQGERLALQRGEDVKNPVNSGTRVSASSRRIFLRSQPIGDSTLSTALTSCVS